MVVLVNPFKFWSIRSFLCVLFCPLCSPLESIVTLLGRTTRFHWISRRTCVALKVQFVRSWCALRGRRSKKTTGRRKVISPVVSFERGEGGVALCQLVFRTASFSLLVLFFCFFAVAERGPGKELFACSLAPRMHSTHTQLAGARTKVLARLKIRLGC